MAQRKRDPNAPKRNISAHLIFQKAKRDEFLLSQPTMSFGELASHTKQQFAALSSSQRQHWLELAQADKDRYDREMESYEPPPGYNKKAMPIQHSKTHRQTLQKLVDPHMPRRPMSAFVLYQNANRRQLQLDHPNVGFGGLAKLASSQYKSLSEEDRGYWEGLAVQDKERYQREMDTYRPPTDVDIFGRQVFVHRPRRKHRKTRYADPDMPKRPLSAYLLWSQPTRRLLQREYPGITFHETAFHLGERWRKETPYWKAHYEKEAERDRQRYRKEMHLYKTKQQMKALDEARAKTATAGVTRYHEGDESSSADETEHGTNRTLQEQQQDQPK